VLFAVCLTYSDPLFFTESKVFVASYAESNEQKVVDQIHAEVNEFLCYPNVHCSVRKSPPFDLILSQLSSSHISTSYLYKFGFKIIKSN
jgi:hypothetical protein